MAVDNTTSTRTRTAALPRCYFCFSTDTMPPFRRSARIFIVSMLVPLRWRYCRKCARHFITTGRPRTG